MSSYDTWHNLLSGISQGSFDKIYIRDANGNMVGILTLLAGAGGTVTIAILPLSINSGVLSLDLSGFCTSAHQHTSIADRWTDDHRLDTLLHHCTNERCSRCSPSPLCPDNYTWILFHYSSDEHCNHKRSRHLRHKHCADKCIWLPIYPGNRTA